MSDDKKKFPKPDKNKSRTPLPNYKRGYFNILIIVVVVISMMMMLQQWQSSGKIRFDQFESYVENGYVESFTVKDSEIVGSFNEKGISQLGDKIRPGFVVNYKPAVHGEGIGELIANNEVKNDAEQSHTWITNLIGMFLPILILIGFFYFIIGRNMKGGGGMLMSFGRSKHRLHGKDKVQVTFNDVAGIEEAKDEVAEIIEFLKNPKKFQRLGGRIPRGVLLVGSPGCGKTLLAKAIAGEAAVPFFSISGSDFVEMFVGVGASRVRDLFKQAKDNSPCIIFLDEIDAIGRKRGAGFASGGHDEREQTLNAILVEMDGFDTNDQVIVIAATNRGDILDNALTRPGRFDRQIYVPLPDIKGRVDILKVHAKKIKLSEDVDLERVARGTPMFSGADLAAIINEAALAATMANKDSVETADLEEARDKVRWGRAKKSRVIDKKDREVTAYHEAGHTLVQSMLDDADPLHKVSIIPRGPMGGATFALPEKDRTLFTKRYCLALMQVCFGGRIAEELFCDDISSGAQSDIQQATKIAKQMVKVWGMSENLGPIGYMPDSEQENMMSMMGGGNVYSEKTSEEIDGEIKRMTNLAYDKARELIEANRDKLENVAQALLKYETLDAEDVQVILDGGVLDKPTVADLLKAEQEAKEEKAAEADEKKEDSVETQEESEEKDSD